MPIASVLPALMPLETTLGTPQLPTGVLLAIAVAGIAVLLVLIIRFKIQAFVALLLVSIAVAISTKIPLTEVFTVVATGVGTTMGKVALLIALGAILGRIIETSGGVQSLADHFTAVLGPRRVALALTAVGFLVAIPVFFEVGVIVLVPIVYAFSKIAGVHPVKFGLPMAGIMLAVHVSVPPHPGIVAASGSLGASIGLVAAISLIICIPLGVISYAVAKIMNRREYALLPGVRQELDKYGDAQATIHTDRRGNEVAPPSAGTIIFLVAAPIAQILIGTFGALLVEKGSAAHSVLTFIGTPVFALVCAVMLAFFLLPVRRGWSLNRTNEVFEEALPPIASILLVVAAGGVFGEVLRASGIGQALSTALDQLGLPLIGLAFVITLALRAAQGSATVAIVTTVGLLSPAIAAAGYTPVQIAIMTVAIGFGSLGLSMVTDAGFWTVTRYYGLSVADGLRTWTVLTTILGLVGFGCCLVLWQIAKVAGW